MDITSILYPVLSVGGLGLVFGAGLGFAGKVFAVEEDPRIPEQTVVAAASLVVMVLLLPLLQELHL